jgi:heme-degrading monooxygenase HmoA
MIMFVNSFAVPEGREEDFLVQWKEVNRYMAAKPGYVDHHLHRSATPSSHFRFVNIVRWTSVDAWDAAHDEGFRALVRRSEWEDFRSTPAVYEDQPVHEGRS